MNVGVFPRVKDTTPNEAVSARSYREGVEWRIRFIDWVFSWYETEHCRKSFEKDYIRSRGYVDDNATLFVNPRTFDKNTPT